MKKIYEQTNIVKLILGTQNIDENKKYRKFFYLTECPVDDGILLYNTITYELLFLEKNDIELFNNPDVNNPLVKYLIEQYFLVPEDFDDKKLGDQIINTRLQIQNIYTEKPLSYFVILPTTGCNARCFYCFEQGAKVSNMTEKTAHDIADFIEKKGAEKVLINWFGGEPLVNLKVIDIISKDLTEKNVNFSSNMVSNAYLLDEDVIERAVDLWKLEKIQITLDGTEEVYNKIKDYVYKDVSSPFLRVMKNIENALNAGIQVNIRLNMDEHNADDLFELLNMLVKKFNKYKNCYIYIVRLFEDVCAKLKNRAAADRHKIIEKSLELQKIIDDNMPKPSIPKLSKAFSTPNTCMACSDNSVMIVPDGHLGKCEHFVDSDFYGSIYSDEIDLKKIMRYKERKVICDKCANCNFRSLCIALKCCTGVPTHCDDIDKMAMTARLHSKLLNIYDAYKKQNNK